MGMDDRLLAGLDIDWFAVTWRCLDRMSTILHSKENYIDKLRERGLVCGTGRTKGKDITEKGFILVVQETIRD